MALIIYMPAPQLAIALQKDTNDRLVNFFNVKKRNDILQIYVQECGQNKNMKYVFIMGLPLGKNMNRNISVRTESWIILWPCRFYAETPGCQ